MTNTAELKHETMADPGRKPRVTPDDALQVFGEREDPAEPLTASELGDALKCSRRTALNKLHTREDREEVASKKVGGRSRVWWVPLRNAERTPRAVFDDDDLQDTPTTTLDDTDAESGGNGGGAVFPDLRDRIPGSGDNLEGRLAAVRDIWEYLKENGSGQRADFKEVVDVEPTGYKSFNSFYTNCTDNGALLAALPGVKSPGEGGHTYRYDP